MTTIHVCKALTVRQPWASLIARGIIEQFPMMWPTNYRGPLAIHADTISSEPGIDELCARLTEAGFRRTQHAVETGIYPLGAVIAIVQLVACQQVAEGSSPVMRGVDVTLGAWAPGRYAWRFENPDRIDPYPARGRRDALWDVGVPL